MGTYYFVGESREETENRIYPMSAVVRVVLGVVEWMESPYIFPGNARGKRIDFLHTARRGEEKAGLLLWFTPQLCVLLVASGQVDYTLQYFLICK